MHAEGSAIEGMGGGTTAGPASLDPGQVNYLLQLLCGNDPLHLHFQTPLWTPAAVAEMIGDEFEIPLGTDETIDLLARTGIVPLDPWLGVPSAERLRYESWLGAELNRQGGAFSRTPPWCLAESRITLPETRALDGSLRRGREFTALAALGPHHELAFWFCRYPAQCTDRVAFLLRLRQLMGAFVGLAPGVEGFWRDAFAAAAQAGGGGATLLEPPDSTGSTASGLFRQEVLVARQRRLEGEVLVVRPVTGRFLSAALGVALVAAGLFAATARFTRTETAPGVLMPVEGTVRLRAPTEGVVTQVPARVGDAVTAGQSLLSLRSERRDAEGVAVDHIRVDELTESLERLETQIDALDAQQRLERHQREATLEDRERALAGAAEQHNVQLSRQQLAADKLERQRSLAEKGVLSRVQWQELQEQGLALRVQTLSIARELQSARTERDTARTRLAQFPAEAAQQRDSLLQQRADLTDRLTQARLAAGSQVSAPRNGRVAAVLVTPGETVKAGQPLVVVVDDSVPLEARLLLPSRAMGFLRVGQAVQLKLDAFTFQRYGALAGTIREVAGVAVTGEDLLDAGLASTEPLYPVSVQLARQHMPALGESRPLTAGMRLSADIVIDRPSLLDWILEPLYSLRGR
ncbi:HlyD family secretion protein [Tahibacter amnicola]|uniref:HlyD family efflux transporter periplasmic adaptor subunit n=1 Tax=Tahibacter amnicola TaxID=2976241 RepID=A0ABY6B9H3_9GAMM|nr:HlyD family efflux transporter periplasmic adaptor subunit [Tahibacter amnicola]UXI66708.1 HlyD family efflux transporter periplasmic adaptor subunit [Tahibacter amnicola]